MKRWFDSRDGAMAVLHGRSLHSLSRDFWRLRHDFTPGRKHRRGRGPARYRRTIEGAGQFPGVQLHFLLMRLEQHPEALLRGKRDFNR